MTSLGQTMSNQRLNNIQYVNFEISNVQQRRINAVYFTVDMNNVRQRWKNVVIFNVQFHSVDQHQNNVVYMTIFKKLKRAQKYFWASKKRWFIWLTTLAFGSDWLKRKGNMDRTM